MRFLENGENVVFLEALVTDEYNDISYPRCHNICLVKF